MDTILFMIFAAIAVIAAVNVVVRTHPIASALGLIVVMGSLAVMYLMLGAPFIAAVQVIVYAGAIMVLFVFVIMLLNAGAEKKSSGSAIARYLGVPLLVSLLGLTSYVIYSAFPESAEAPVGGFTEGSPANVGRLLFTRYLLPFEITSVLVLIAIAGAVILAYKEME